MKKAVVFIGIIICLLLIATTKMLIDLKLAQNESAKPTSTSAPIATPTPTTTKPIDEANETIEEAKDEATKEEHKRIVLGKSTYKTNPIKIEQLEDKDNSKTSKDSFGNEKTYYPSYSQISGLKDKSIESKINKKLKEEHLVINNSDEIANFSNILSYNFGYEGFKPYNINLVDGSELTIEDFFYDKNEVKSNLSKYIVKELYDAFDLGPYIETKAKDKEAETNLTLFYGQIEDWTYQIMRKYENNDFDFYFNRSNLYLYFDNFVFKNPMNVNYDDRERLWDEEYLWLPNEEINKLKVELPLYDIYPYVSIFDKYSDATDIYDSNDFGEKIIGLDDFVKVTDNMIYYEYDANDFSFGDEQKVIINKNQEKWKQKYNELLIIKDKEIIAINDLNWNMFEGGYTILNFYIAFNKNTPEAEKAYIYEFISKAYNSIYYRKIEEIRKINSLKNKYKDVEIYLNEENTWVSN